MTTSETVRLREAIKAAREVVRTLPQLPPFRHMPNAFGVNPNVSYTMRHGNASGPVIEDWVGPWHMVDGEIVPK